MKGKVCILGSFNVDIIANVDRFPQSGESIFQKIQLLALAVKAQIRRWQSANVMSKRILSEKSATINLAS